MREVVYRRYKRLSEEGEPLPQLIIIDGGKGQLSHAMEALEELGLRGKIAIIGIAKRLEEIFFPGDSLPLFIDKRSSTLKLIQHLRNEAHRFLPRAPSGFTKQSRIAFRVGRHPERWQRDPTQTHGSLQNNPRHSTSF